ncbi:HesB/YadR/YfhF family protein [Oceanobacillus halophilus]|uniref:HesB/YadR/YfhF family protein n=1 Tax=Oceanobacillus halophilus TaxID=930130 RepID=A0A494ZW48_9BACI|nr:hypothetical protein [Oceanobacillus halophilus]RKQ30795.1 hypothetical protein D8M06_15365 [Oceanobacillus halophilus]
MKLQVTEDAAKWFIEEMGLEKGELVQFRLKIYGGIPTVHPNYFLGLTTGENGKIAIKDEVEGITFYFNDKDAWFLDEHDMKVEMGEEEVEYHFEERK